MRGFFRNITSTPTTKSQLVLLSANHGAVRTEHCISATPHSWVLSGQMWIAPRGHSRTRKTRRSADAETARHGHTPSTGECQGKVGRESPLPGGRLVVLGSYIYYCMIPNDKWSLERIRGLYWRRCAIQIDVCFTLLYFTAELQNSAIPVPHWSSTVEFWITRYDNPGRLRHAGSRRSVSEAACSITQRSLDISFIGVCSSRN